MDRLEGRDATMRRQAAAEESRRSTLHAPLRSLAQLDQARLVAETVEVLSQTRLLWWNRAAIRADFPTLASVSDEDLERFVLENASVLSRVQCAPNEVNAEPPLTGVQRIAWRPPMYGRALIVEACPPGEPQGVPIGLLDLKGAGVAPDNEPMRVMHRNGLMILEQCIEELLYQRLVETVMRRENIDARGVPVYAILSLGFEGSMENTMPLPAAMMIRRAHRRFAEGCELQPIGSSAQKVQLTLELVLRRYGITTANTSTFLTIWRDAEGEVHHHYGGHPAASVESWHLERLLAGVGLNLPPEYRVTFEGVNVQTTRDVSLDPLSARIVDFGHYKAVEHFVDPIFSIVGDRFLNFGGVFWPQDPAWVQPDPDHRVNWEVMRPRKMDAQLREWVEGRGAATDEEALVVSGMTEAACRLAWRVHFEDLNRDNLDTEMSGIVAAVLPGVRS